MLAGYTPFATGPQDTPHDILKRIGEGQLDMTSGNWQTVSPAAKVDIVIIVIPSCSKFSYMSYLTKVCK